MATTRSSHPLSTQPAAAPATGRPPRVLVGVWTQPAARIAAAAVLALIAGLLIALVMPRGPVTTGQAHLLMVTGMATGVFAGLALRSRWAMLLAPIAFVGAFELGRLGESGPTVDGIELGTTFGIMGLLVSRGVFVVLGLLPMVLGVAYGAALARWLRNEPTGRHGIGASIRRAVGGLGTLAVVALAFWIALPASAPPVTGADGEPIEGSIAELTEVAIGGNQQWLEIRGASEDLPVLLYLSGGPGQSDLAFSRVLLDDLTQDFIVVGWDQRGNGKSYADWDAEAMTLDRAVADTIEVATYLRERFDEEKIYVLGESWGTTLAVLAAQEAPEQFHALIGSGQMVSQRETDRRIYEDLLAYAAAHDDEALADTLAEIGPPPYADVWAYGYVLTQYEKLEGAYDPPQAYEDRAQAGDVGFWGVMGSEYAAIDKANLFRGLIDTFAVLYPQLQGIDFREDVTSLEVPVYILDGEHELRGRRDLAHEWYALLDAPDKRMYTFENAGHAVAFEHADELHRILLEDVLPATYPTR